MRFNSTNNSNLEQNNNKKHSCSPSEAMQCGEELLGPDNLTPPSLTDPLALLYCANVGCRAL